MDADGGCVGVGDDADVGGGGKLAVRDHRCGGASADPVCHLDLGEKRKNLQLISEEPNRFSSLIT